MGQDDAVDAARGDTSRFELSFELVLGIEFESRQANNRVSGREVSRLCRSGGLPGVEQASALRMLDEIGVHRQDVVLPVVDHVTEWSTTCPARAHDTRGNAPNRKELTHVYG